MTASIPSPSCAPTRSTQTENRIGAVRGLGRGPMGRLVGARRRRLSRQRQPQPPRRRAAEQHVRRPADARRPGLAPARRPPADRRRRASGRGFPRPRHRLLRRHRPGPRRAASPPWSANGGRNGPTGSSPTSPCATTVSAPSRTRPRFRASLLVRPGGGLDAARRLWRGHRPADLLRSVRLLPRLVRRQSGPAARERRAAGKRACAGANERVALGVTGFSARLRDEIVDMFDPGHLPLEHRQRRPAGAGATASSSTRDVAPCRLAATSTPTTPGSTPTSSVSPATALVREVRRPRHSANLVAPWRERAASAGARASLMSASGATRISICSRRRR